MRRLHCHRNGHAHGHARSHSTHKARNAQGERVHAVYCHPATATPPKKRERNLADKTQSCPTSVVVVDDPSAVVVAAGSAAVAK